MVALRRNALVKKLQPPTLLVKAVSELVNMYKGFIYYSLKTINY